MPNQPPRTVALTCHPTSPSIAVQRIAVDVHVAADGGLRLRYFVDGDIECVRIPGRTPAQRAANLWQHTCFEAFTRGLGDAYCEFNFSPSTAWATYGFSRYREGMSQIELAREPSVAVSVAPDRLALEATIGPEALLSLPGNDVLQLAICAVIEEIDDRISYWALTHPAERPDFHHPDGFVLQIVRPSVLPDDVRSDP
jgi:hypothetical protein